MLFNQQIFLTLLLTLCLSSSSIFAQSNYSIQFLQETFTPSENVSEFNAADNNYVLLQFKTIPNQATLQQIKAAGIILDDYIPSNTYYAFVPNSVDAAFLKTIQVRAFSSFKSKWKKSFDTDNIPEHANLIYGQSDLNIKYFKSADMSEVANILQAHNAEILYIADQFHTFKIRIPIENIDALANESIIKSVDLIAPPTTIQNERSRANHRSNALAASYNGGRNLKGNGVVIGVWDTNLYPHTDFGTRVTGHQYLYAGASGDHANHVTGTIAGAGWLDPTAIGMSPEATVHNWNCCTQTPDPGYVMMQNAVVNQGITITNNSYGFGADCDNTPTYFNVNANYDQVVYDNPNLMHVFSAGNSQGDCPGGFFTVSWTHKNSLIVAATNQTSAVTNFSSFGPLFDGRIAPTISGVGSNVYSTEWDNGYGNKSGTSMSGPGVAGTIAQIYERYKQLYNGINPDAALVKALVCNTADDVGNKGPDYKYGFGQINGLKAVEEMEAGNWLVDSISQGVQNTLNITVPNNAVETRIMLTWTDIPGNSSAAISLVNDLDLFLTNGTDTIYPWVLNMNSPNAVATRGEDHINNIVQITADTLPAGSWTVVVEGETVTNSSQTYALVYQTYTPEIVVTYPFGGEKLEASDPTTIRWTAAGITNSQLIEFSTNAGQSWQTIGTGNYPNPQRATGWNTPYVLTNKALVRITSGNIVGQSDTTFTISPIPNFSLDIDPNSSLCGEQARLRWTSIPNATEYEVFQIDSLGVHSVAIVTDTFYFASNLDTDTEYWFSMRALNTTQGVVGRRSVARKIELRPSYDIAINKVKSPISACQMGLEQVILEVQNNGCYTLQTGAKIPMTIDLNGVMTSDTITISNKFAQGNILTFALDNPIDFSQPGAYAFTFSNTLIGDTTDYNDVLSREIIHQPTYNTLPYVESFETNNGFWTDKWTNFSTWEWGTPNNSIINTASNGNKVWMTDKDADYKAHENSQLISPCFNFSTLTQDPYLVYDVNHDLGEIIDRARMSYSLNDGASWTNLGSTFFLNQSNGWETIETQLNGAAGQSDVKFRMTFKADGNTEYGNGIALDYFRINQSTNTTKIEEAFSVLVYPNPSFSHFNLTIDQSNANNIQIKMLDAVGKLVHEQLIENTSGRNSWRIETSHLSKGMYFLNVNIDGQQVTRKVIVN
jgi:subtilisin family serine protease